MKESTVTGLERIGEKLYRLQESKNEGCGVSCVRDIALLLKKGMYTAAKQVAMTDFDKIRSYPDIANYVNEVFCIES